MIRYVVPLGLLACASSAAGQDANAWREPFAAGQQALTDDDHAAYAERMAHAVRPMPAGHLNRLFAQHHAARAAALLADTTAAVAFLHRTWDEAIESLMISLAEYDSAFAAIVGSRGFKSVMGLAARIEFSVEPLGGSVYLVSGAGSNVMAQVGEDGILLIANG